MPPIDLQRVLELALAIAAALGALKAAAELFKRVASALRARYRATPSKIDDVPLELGARLAEMAAEAALNGDISKVRDLVNTAVHLVPPALRPVHFIEKVPAPPPPLKP